ncbi:hypothetical protein GXW82_44490 [Streptacidiphilus sp. 4-A2]|nr:hypothetical protein [Streptacidiphilus sp. 4-A2]
MNIDTATTVPVTWTTGSSTVTAQFPVADTHTMYADSFHTGTVAQLADMPQQQVQLDSTVTGGDNVGSGVAVVVLGGLCWYAIKHKGHTWLWMIIAVAMGTFLGASSFGVLIHDTFGQLLNSVITSVSGVA